MILAKPGHLLVFKKVIKFVCIFIPLERV